MAVVSGCGSGVPADFPKVTKCTITVTENGKPIEGVYVQVIPQQEVNSLSIVGRTDASGKAVIYSYLGTYQKVGVPLGSSSVTLNKQREPEHFKSEAEREAMGQDIVKLDAYNAELKQRMTKLPPLVPPALTKKTSTPLKIDAQIDQPVELMINLDDYRK
ncbi:MAG: hypothetical protein LBC02_02910 [Planctomycetaceae bacterium]|nr:hypothetical protein [Planctomycetaceae bacterium]